MANELSISALLSAVKGSISRELKILLKQATMSGADASILTQLVTTSESALYIPPAIGTVGWFLGINRDATNFIKIRPGTGATDLCKLLPGEPALFRLVATAPYVIADTASCQLEYLICEA